MSPRGHQWRVDFMVDTGVKIPLIRSSASVIQGSKHTLYCTSYKLDVIALMSLRYFVLQTLF